MKKNYYFFFSLSTLIEKCWNADYNKRPSFKEIIYELDNIILECVIMDQEARNFWKEYFLEPKQVNIMYKNRNFFYLGITRISTLE